MEERGQIINIENLATTMFSLKSGGTRDNFEINRITIQVKSSLLTNPSTICLIASNCLIFFFLRF